MQSSSNKRELQDQAVFAVPEGQNKANVLGVERASQRVLGNEVREITGVRSRSVLQSILKILAFILSRNGKLLPNFEKNDNII